jgi:hypothetical protein
MRKRSACVRSASDQHHADVLDIAAASAQVLGLHVALFLVAPSCAADRPIATPTTI